MPRDRTCGSRLRPLAARRLRAYASASDSLLTAGLIGHYKCLQGANAATVYDETGNYHASRRTSYEPNWTSAGLQFLPSVTMVDFPIGLSNAIKTDLWCFQIQVGSVQGITNKWTIWTDGRPKCSSWTSSSEVQLGNRIFTQVYPAAAAPKLYWGERESYGYMYPAVVTPGPVQYWGWTTGYPYSGYLYYRLCWDVELTAEQVASQARWVAGQVALRGVTLANTASGPYLIGLGDSITHGVVGAVDDDWTKRLRGKLATTRIGNFGIGGTYLFNLAAEISGQCAGIFASNSGGENVAIIARGSNDIGSGGQNSSSAMLGHVADCVAAARAAGATKVIVRTIPRGKWTYWRTQVSGDAVLEAVNDGIVANAFGADAIADTWTSGPLGVSGDITNHTYYYTDDFHLVGGGQEVIAAAVETALGAVGIT